MAQLFAVALELANEIVRIKYSNNFQEKHVAIIISKNAVVVVDVETSSTVHSFTSSKDSAIIDCDYDLSNRIFWVLFADHTVSLVPDNASSLASLARSKLPAAALRVDVLETKGAIITFQSGQLLHFVLAKDSLVLPTPSETVSHAATVPVIGTCCRDGWLGLIASPKAMQVLAMQPRTASAGSASWLTPGASPIASSTVLSGASDSLVAFGFMQLSNALYVVTSAKSAGVWTKVDTNGRKLFGRSLSEQPLGATCLGHTVWVMHESSITGWDERYGVKLHSVATELPASISSPRLSSVLFSASRGSASSGSDSVVYRAFVANKVSSSSSLVLQTPFLPARATGQRLLDVVGLLPSTAPAPASAAVVATKATPGKRARKGSDAGDGEKSDVAGSMSPSEREALAALVTASVGIKTETDAALAKKYKKIVFNADHSSALAFLTKLQAFIVDNEEEGVSGRDWATVQAAAHAGIFSVTAHRAIFTHAATVGRLDVLLAIAKYSVDLSEKDAVRLLLAVVAISPELVCKWRSGPSAAVEEVAVAAGVAASGKKSAKKKKAEAGLAMDPTAVGLDHVLLVSSMIDCILNRRDGFSSILLTEALTLLATPHAAVTLLRLFVVRIRGVCAPSAQQSWSNTVAEATGADAVLRKTVQWVESLLDSHFSATITNIMHHAPTRTAVVAVMEAVGPAAVGDATEQLEGALGLWTHISRMNKAKFSKSSPAVTAAGTSTLGMYSIDKLLL